MGRNQHRRLSGDYEYLTDTGEVMIQIAMIGIMLHRPVPEVTVFTFYTL
ncbi:MAG: hypothetical protein HC887_09785 [Desulfobacteraceae bacterium]|nr:hypothetical protein [Desulfobacteraceae bacterium]